MKGVSHFARSMFEKCLHFVNIAVVPVNNNKIIKKAFRKHIDTKKSIKEAKRKHLESKKPP